MSLGDKWVPSVDEEICDSCGICVETCGARCLEIVAGVAVLARPEACVSEARCVAPCPQACIRMGWLPLRGDRSVGEWRDGSGEE